MARLVLLNMPIGDLGDMSTRVHMALKDGVHFAVEDSRSFRELLSRLQIKSENKHILSLHDHSSEAKFDRLLDMVASGQDLYVCSEAGSPILSDPAYPLVRRAYERNLEVETYSGISAVTAALELSGLPALPYAFHGFLPREESRVRTYLSQLGAGTHVFFEAPGRIRETLRLACEMWPAGEFAVVKEMSKTYQKVFRFKADATDWLPVQMERGEFVWLVHLGVDPRQRVPESLRLAALEILKKGEGKKNLSKLLAEILGQSSKEIYAELTKAGKE